jgi:quinol monooxygenase YgiN
MYVIKATIPLDPDEREAGVEAARELARNCREHEDGVIDYRVAVDVDDETVLRFFEQYEDEAAVEAHGETDHYQAFQEQIPEFIGGEAEVVRFEVSEATELQ